MGTQPLPQKGRSPTQFSGHLYCGQMAAICMDPDATWYGAWPRPTFRCVRCGPSYAVRFADGTRYATDCVRRLWLTPSRATSIRNIYMHVCVCVCCLVANVTDLAHPCDDRMSHGCRSRGLVGSQSPACHWSDIRSGAGSRLPSSPGISCRGTSWCLDAVRVCEFSGVLYAYLRVNSTSFVDVELFFGK